MPTTSLPKLEVRGLDYAQDHILSAPTLVFSVGRRPTTDDPDGPRRLIPAVDAALARRADGPDVDALDISFVYGVCRGQYAALQSQAGYALRHGHAADITSAHLSAWLRFAARRVTGSFALAVPPVPPAAPSTLPLCVKRDTSLEARLPATARAETMSLALATATLAVPAARAGAFHALTDLLLSQATLRAEADAHNLGLLLSSCCSPRLRRLRLEHIDGLATLRLDAACTLQELRLLHVPDLSSLELYARGLRALHIESCPSMSSLEGTARISAPRLESLVFGDVCGPDRLELTGAASVRRLGKLHLWSHCLPDTNGAAVGLLQRCAAAESVDLTLMPPIGEHWTAGHEVMSLLPQLPRVASLNLDAWTSVHIGYAAHRLGRSVATLVARCSNVQRLQIAFTYWDGGCSDPDCFCRQGDNNGAMGMSLERLREAKITGFRPSLDDQASLVRLLVASAPGLETMTLELCDTEGAPDLEMVPCDRGHWSCVSDSGSWIYTWTPEMPSGEQQDEEEASGSCYVM
ncbi:hypothetical protein BRADI_4g06160v3 [Brachypodium distachyon]|uniref:Uncharacterized protein n=1 Tax=Brachypodium distachyon TaxID=15368 RepID=I1II03_BRADI|nr:hypothetical protein BRADI_4g06160v3 [Brachypodium distachyon]